MIVYIITLIISLITFVSLYRNSEISQVLESKLGNYKLSVRLLLIWILFGFLTRLDFNQMFGCVIYFGKIFDYNNIGFSLFSFALILSAGLLKNKKTSTILLIVELLFWLFRYFYYKGGYATGLAGSYPLDFVVLYDSIAIFLRLLVLVNLVKTNFKTPWIILVVVILTSIKIFFFQLPHDLFWEEIKRKNKIEENTGLIKGSWKGVVRYDSLWVDTIRIYRLDTISKEVKEHFDIGANRIVIDSLYKYCLNDRSKNIIDTIDVFIDNELTFHSRLMNYKINFNYPFGGELTKKRDSIISLDGNFSIYKLDIDSLVVRMSYGNIFSLKRVTTGNKSYTQ